MNLRRFGGKFIHLLLVCLLTTSAVVLPVSADPVISPGSGGLGSSPTTLTGENNSDYFGNAVASAGDVNGDGYPDVLVGANCWPTPQCRGRANLYFGGSGGLSASPALTLSGENDGDRFGVRVAAVGDINNDSYPGFAVGSQDLDSIGRIRQVHLRGERDHIWDTLHGIQRERNPRQEERRQSAVGLGPGPACAAMRRAC